MVRKILDCPITPTAKSHVTELKLEIDFISPLFGGAVTKGKNDIRESSIRGQLRFWWRATIGANYDSVQQMRQKENEIFGSTDKASNVILKITNREIRTERPFNEFNLQNSYVLFPFRGQRNQPNITGLKNIKFNLQVKILKNEIVEDIKKTLKAWINFGGLGSRTRRGLGSLYCEEYAFKNINELNLFVKQNNNVEFPSINRIFYKHIQGNFDLVNKFYDTTNYLKTFRQGKNIGRNPGEDRPGRSLWPEADTLGEIFNRIPKHQDRITEGRSFPRAEFGLPIIIDFRIKGEPPQTQVLPENSEQTRFASPIILKNIKLSNGQVYNLIIKLNSKLPKKVRLSTKEGVVYDVNWKNKKTVNGSAIEGFMEFIKNNGFTEINGGAK